MQSSLLLSLCLLALAFAVPDAIKNLKPTNENGGVNWAVLVAGSNTWGNYRHQADICHAYQVLKENGFSDEYVIVMMYDDIAHNLQNPFPGEVFNKENGPDVYAGVPKDYIGSAVTASNFYNVLQGITTKGGSGKVIRSTHLDNIFVFYSDHGSVGLICMPVGPYVYADDLSVVLKSMASSGKFNKFLFYVEACESGSLFYQGLLPSNINIFATTASTPFESSWACNYSPELYTYLGDCYSVNWMDYTESVNVEKTSVETEFLAVKQATTGSTVCSYGATELSNDMLSVYMEGKTNHTLMKPQVFHPASGPVDQRIVEEGILKERYSRAKSNEERANISREIEELQKQRRDTQSLFIKLAVQTLGVKYAHKTQEVLELVPQLLVELKHKFSVPKKNPCEEQFEIGELVFRNFECYKSMTEMVRETCGPMDSYALQFTPMFASLCEASEEDYSAFDAALKSVCPTPIWN